MDNEFFLNIKKCYIYSVRKIMVKENKENYLWQFLMLEWKIFIKDIWFDIYEILF